EQGIRQPLKGPVRQSVAPGEPELEAQPVLTPEGDPTVLPAIGLGGAAQVVVMFKTKSIMLGTAMQECQATAELFLEAAVLWTLPDQLHHDEGGRGRLSPATHNRLGNDKGANFLQGPQSVGLAFEQPGQVCGVHLDEELASVPK